jgi:hypothetical protein
MIIAMFTNGKTNTIELAKEYHATVERDITVMQLLACIHDAMAIM